MKIKFKNTIILILLITFLAGCDSNTDGMEGENANLNELLTQSGAEEVENNTHIPTRDEKMEEIKKKLALKGLISKGDMYFNDREYTIALAQYIKVLKDLPNDKDTLRKIGDIYYEQKKWTMAYEYYKKAKDYSGLDKQKVIYSLINGLYEGESNLNYINDEIDSFNLTNEEILYYKNSLICTINFSKCRANFEEYFKNLADNTEISFTDLALIRDTFTNYKNFQLEDLVYKAALITGGFYKNGFYFVALKTGQDILKDNPEYKPIIKIVAKSAYELGNYNLAKDYIINFNKIQTDDAEASYFLGRTYEKLGEKVLSSVHFTKALRLGYIDQNDIRRRLIFLYYELDDTEKMLNMFKEMMESEDTTLTINDYSLAIHYLIANDELETAKKYSEQAKQKFKDSELFYGYYAWIMLQNENLTTQQLKVIKDNIDYAKKIAIQESPMLSMVTGIYYMKTKNYEEAELEFKNAKQMDTTREYSETIDYWLKQIQNEEE